MAIKLAKIPFIAIVLLLLSSSLFSNDIFNSKLTAQEKKKLENGEILIRNIGKAKNMSLNPVTDGAQDVIDAIYDLDPAYLAEVIQVRPYEGNEHLLDELQPLLLDIEGYVGIPYYSERNGSYYDLYSSAEVLSKNISENSGSLNADLYMSPFGNINVDIAFDSNESELFYSMTNTGNVKYEGINIVREENMQSLVYVFRYEDSIVLYGIGGVDAFSIFFLRDRIETSFINRIKTFCQFIFEKL